MTKLTIDDLAAYMPKQLIIAALDDDQVGFVNDEAFCAVIASANARAAAIFGGEVPARYSAAVDYAVRVFALDLLYRRRGDDDDKNPWAHQADDEAARLKALATGTESIDATSDGVVISKPAKIYNSTGVMS